MNSEQAVQRQAEHENSAAFEWERRYNCALAHAEWLAQCIDNFNEMPWPRRVWFVVCGGML